MRRRRWNSCQLRDATDTEHSSCRRMHQTSRTQTIHRQMPLGSDRGRIPWKNDYPTKNRPSRQQNPETLSKRTIPEIKETSTEIHRLCQLLLQLYSAVVRKATRFLRATESKQTNQGHRRIARPLQSDQRSASGGMWIGPQTTNHRTTIRPNDGC